MVFSEITRILKTAPSQFFDESEITRLGYDTRILQGGDGVLFFALSGQGSNGHHYLSNAYQSGVRNFVISEEMPLTEFPDSNIIKVEDTLIALQTLATHHRQNFEIPVIGITGSNGKTIVKEWLSDILQEKYRVVKSPKSYNSQLGVALSVWQIASPDQIGIFEAGISKQGEMKSLQQIIQPTIGIFTNIGEAHSQGFDSLEKKIAEKAVLFASCEQIICCADHQNISEYLKNNCSGQLITWSTKAKVATADLFFNKTASGLACEFEGKTYHFEILNHQGYYLENLLNAITASLVGGLSNEEINLGLKRIRPVAMRLEFKRGINDCYILDDTYNNDLTGIAIALNYLKLQAQNKKKTVILSDIEQSGLNAATLYTRVNDLLVSNDIDRFIGVGPTTLENRNQFSLPTTFYASTAELLKQMPAFENELILIKGARSFSLEKVAALLEEQNHGTVLEVNFESLVHNLNTYRKSLSDNTKLMVMVKAFAYGGGLSEIAHLLQYQNVDYLGVAYLDEGVALRQKGITLPIMVMNPDWDHLSQTEAFQLEPEIYSLSMLQKLIEHSKNPSPIHLKIETGMNRLGFREEELEALIKVLLQNPQVKIAGIFTHFAGAEDAIHDAFTRDQAEKLNAAYAQIVKAIGYAPIKHALNSSGIIRWPDYHFDMVRLGIGLYGHDSSQQLQRLRPISTLKSRISQIRAIEAGESIGYSRKGLAQRKSKIAIVSIGYADGYQRKFGNGQAYMLINGQQAPTIGNICMDMTMLDVTDLEVNEGDEVVVFGQSPSIEDLAEWAETIPYEILTNVSQRVKRVFVSE